jgi:hypothetical protein
LGGNFNCSLLEKNGKFLSKLFWIVNISGNLTETREKQFEIAKAAICELYPGPVNCVTKRHPNH